MTTGSAAGSAAGEGAHVRSEPPRTAVHEAAVPKAAVDVRGLVKRYGARVVLDGVSMSVHRGELVALLGPNGAGKTTTVEIIEGYRRADGGMVRVLGQDPATGGPRLRARVGLMLQDGGFDPRAEPRETLIQYGRFHRNPRDADELIDLVGLRAVARTRYRRLSGGERQRLGLAVALVGRPDVLVLDEPTAGMDPEARAATRAIVADLRYTGAAILLTSHDLGDVERMADRVDILVGGRIAASGSPAELAARARPQLRFRLDRQLDAAESTSLGEALSAARPGARLLAEATAGGRYRIDGIAPDAALVAILANWCAAAGRLVVELRAGGGTLEDVYLEIVEQPTTGAEGAATISAAEPSGPAPAGTSRRAPP